MSPSQTVERLALAVLLTVSTVASAHAAAPPSRDVTIAAADGTSLKATYYGAPGPGPAVLLLHMCNTARRSWEPLGHQLSEAGMHALALDYRGFGESGGARFDTLGAVEAAQVVNGTWPRDIDAALTYLLSQPGVDGERIGVAGGSCGVTQAVQVARRHRNVRALVLLAGPTNPDGFRFLLRNPWLPVFTSAAADDQYDNDAPDAMRWLGELSGNPRNTFMGFTDGKHGTEIFGPHPELPRAIVAWLTDTLVRSPANPGTTVTPTEMPSRELWALLDQRDGIPRAVQRFHDARSRDPKAFLFPEPAMNLAGYELLQGSRTKDAIALFQMNVEAYPTSANAQDSLGDAYFADGQNALALAASEKCLALLPADHGDERRKAAIRASAEEKIQKLKAPAR
jgi:dienelactone hydrolase